MLVHRIYQYLQTHARRPMGVLASGMLVIAALAALTFAASSLVAPQTALAQGYCYAPNGSSQLFNSGCPAGYSSNSCSGVNSYSYNTGCSSAYGAYGCNGVNYGYNTGCSSAYGAYGCNGVNYSYDPNCSTASAGYQSCDQNGYQVQILNGQYCGTVSAYSCNGTGYSSPVSCATATTACGNGTIVYAGQACQATYVSCPNGGEVMEGQQCGATVTVSAGIPNTVYTSSTYANSQGFPVSYTAGWNIVAGPSGTTFNNGPMYTFGPGNTTYQILASGSALSSGEGAWAYFSAGTSTSIGLGNPGISTLQLPPGQYVLIGNSGDSPAIVSGADSVLVYNPSTGSYNQTTQLAAGQGAWAISMYGAQVTLTSSPA